MLLDPSDENVMIQHLKDALDVCPNMNESCIRGMLLAKGIEINRQRLRNILNDLKNTSPLNLNPIRQRHCHTRTANSMWHMDETHKLNHWTFAIIGAADGHIRMIIWLKRFNNKKSATFCNYFLNTIEEFQFLFQIQSDKSSEN